MPRYELWQVDAFTTTPLLGNAAAVVLDARGMDDALMQAVAKEMNLSETAYIFPSTRAHFAVRYFTPVIEIPLAGHPTVAVTHVLRESGRIAPNAKRITLDIPAGIIPVDIEYKNGAVRYTMTQPAPRFMRTYERAAIARAMGLDEEDILAGHMPQTVSTGTPQLMIPLASLQALGQVRPNAIELFPGKDRADYFSVHVFARDERGEHALRARHFAPFGDVAEDPVTGSASGGMAAYCLRYGIIRDHEFTAAQGEHVGRPGTVYARVLGQPPDGMTGVMIGGYAVTVLKGELKL